jgi:hypothetical protein
MATHGSYRSASGPRATGSRWPPCRSRPRSLPSGPTRGVALTIGQGGFPPKALLIRGTAEVVLVAGIPDGYLTAAHKVMTDDQYPQWVAGVQALGSSASQSSAAHATASSTTDAARSPRVSDPSDAT